MIEMIKGDPWEGFLNKVRNSQEPLFKRLDEFRQPILIAGCQRSGTTMLTRLINQSSEITHIDYAYQDDELDVAMILSGERAFTVDSSGRYCLQTTYLNDSYREYYNHNNFKLIWVVRNPYSVVHSISNNWSRSALHDLYLTCGKQYMRQLGVETLPKSRWGICESKIHKACYSYSGKSAQIFEIKKVLTFDQLLVVDYDDLVNHGHLLLPEIFKFLNLEYAMDLGKRIHKKSLNKKRTLSQSDSSLVNEICIPLYEKSKKICRKVC